MGQKSYLSMTGITLIIGFMLAVQYHTVKEPIVRDTRDTSQLREDLVKEKELNLSLIREIQSNEEKLEKYETERSQSKEQILNETLMELKSEAGLTEVKGPGILINIEQINDALLFGEPAQSIPPYLIQRLINELNQYGAKHISIADQRLVNSSVIRDINGQTKVDGYSLHTLPIEVKITVESLEVAEKLHNRMQVSSSADDFFVENYQLKISEPHANLIIPAYKDSISIRQMELAETDKGG
ncbi:DUF881 domain-containing protein [Bacillus tuaregi]|uniref:DUF881 domain-containing protein n=1 Tax=Bacillus tuaregi TaxID=1816695 RepID=UPI0008F96C61|nr:DUF881 domain-containing protein [Bacillus tuaregi]